VLNGQAGKKHPVYSGMSLVVIASSRIRIYALPGFHLYNQVSAQITNIHKIWSFTTSVLVWLSYPQGVCTPHLKLAPV